MKYLSVCSGIKAASVAWKPLGWQPVAFSELEAFPCAVLAHHYPDTPNWGDMTRSSSAWPKGRDSIPPNSRELKSTARLAGHWQKPEAMHAKPAIPSPSLPRAGFL